MKEIQNAKERDAEDWTRLFKMADCRFLLREIREPEGSDLAIVVAEWVGGDDETLAGDETLAVDEKTLTGHETSLTANEKKLTDDQILAGDETLTADEIPLDGKTAEEAHDG